MKKRIWLILIIGLALGGAVWERQIWQCWLWPSTITDNTGANDQITGGEVQVFSSDYVSSNGVTVDMVATPDTEVEIAISDDSSLNGFSPSLFLCTVGATQTDRDIFWLSGGLAILGLISILVSLIRIILKARRR